MEQEHLVELLVELVVLVLMETLVLDHTYVVLLYASSYYPLVNVFWQTLQENMLTI